MMLALAGCLLLMGFAWFFAVEYWRRSRHISHDLSFVLSWVSILGFGLFSGLVLLILWLRG
jgi:hypothetical protein